MILSFARKLNGKPTHFVEKITKALVEDNTYNTDEILKFVCNVNSAYSVNEFENCSPKKITIRRDSADYWEANKPLEFHCPERDILFAPTVLVKNTQDIFMSCRGSMLEITIAKVGSYIGGDDFFVDAVTQGQLAIDDGFDYYNDFRNYYLNKIAENGNLTGNFWFSGKIIHWTDLTY